MSSGTHESGRDQPKLNGTAGGDEDDTGSGACLAGTASDHHPKNAIKIPRTMTKDSNVQPPKKLKLAPPPPRRTTRSTSKSVKQRLWEKTDIWIGTILPFVGVGQHLFIAGVNKRLRELYIDYCQNIHQKYKNRKMTCSYEKEKLLRRSEPFCTTLTQFLSTPERAEYWYDLTGGEFDTDYISIFHHTIFSGNLSVFRWAHGKGFDWDEGTCIDAAVHGRLEILMYAHENGCPWDEQVCEDAADRGHLDILKYAHENGCPWDEHACSKAAGSDELECLMYLRQNGCPWDPWTLYEAVGTKSFSCFQWACANGCPWNELVFRLMRNYHRYPQFVHCAREYAPKFCSPDVLQSEAARAILDPSGDDEEEA